MSGLGSWLNPLEDMGLDANQIIMSACSRFGASPSILRSEHLLIEALIKTHDRIKKLEDEIACMKQGKNS